MHVVAYKCQGGGHSALLKFVYLSGIFHFDDSALARFSSVVGTMKPNATAHGKPAHEK